MSHLRFICYVYIQNASKICLSSTQRKNVYILQKLQILPKIDGNKSFWGFAKEWNAFAWNKSGFYFKSLRSRDASTLVWMYNDAMMPRQLLTRTIYSNQLDCMLLRRQWKLEWHRNGILRIIASELSHFWLRKKLFNKAPDINNYYAFVFSLIEPFCSDQKDQDAEKTNLKWEHLRKSIRVSLFSNTRCWNT